MAWRGSFEELEAYLRGFVHFGGDAAPYDCGGVLALWLALLDNLRANHLDAELGDVAGILSPEQADFLLRLADRVREVQAAGTRFELGKPNHESHPFASCHSTRRVPMTDEEIGNLLFVRAAPLPADLVMVFGAAREEDLIRRTRQGVRLYQEGYAPKLLMTGGGTLALTHPEAVRMGELARGLGVPEADLLVESRSSNTFANARYSLELLGECGLLERLRTVLLVSSEWHMRRVLLTVERTFPPGLRLVCCPTLEGCTRETWIHSEACRVEVQQELAIFRAFQEAGLLEPIPNRGALTDGG